MLRLLLWYSVPIMRRPVSFVLAVIVLCSASLSLAGQKFQIRSIQFRGAPEYSEQELLDAAGLKKGALLGEADARGSAKRLMDTGVFENIVYKFDWTELAFTLKLASVLYPIRLGNLPLVAGKELDGKLHDRFPLYHGKVPSEGGLLDGVREALEEMLAGQGIKAAVMASPFTDLKLGKVTAMSFDISAPPVEIGEIRLDSGSAPLEPKAQEILDKQSGSPYDAEGSPNQIATNLGNYYRDKGYLEAEIQARPQLPAMAAPEAIRIPFTVSVSPGILYKISKIQLAPGLVVTQAEFDRQSQIHPGEIADSVRVRENWQYLARQYHNRGYMMASVHPTPSLDRAQGMASFLVTVEPGPVYSMGKLTIENVSDDLRAAMLAAWKMPAGAVFNEGAIRGFFATYNVHPALERVFAAANCKYVLHLNDDTHNVDVVLRLEKRP